MRSMRIAMIGQKGIPARYGGVEKHVERIATLLCSRGHEVWVYCRNRYKGSAGAARSGLAGSLEARDRGAGVGSPRLVFRPSINTKHMDAASHSLFCAVDATFAHGFDIVHFHGIGPSAFAPIPRIAGRRVVSTVHALDWRQVKWGRVAKWALKRGEAVGAKASNGVIAVSRNLQRYLLERYGVEARYIPNGADRETLARRPNLIRKYGLEGNDYLLTVGRIIPERGLHHLIEAFGRVKDPVKLVIAGSETPRSTYSDELEKAADERVIFTGNVYGELLEELYSNCLLYVLASSVEGLSIAVCEAMSYSKGLLLSDIPENLEVAGDSARFFNCGDVNSLYESLNELLKDEGALAELGEKAKRRVEGEYNWERIVEDIERFYLGLL